MTTQFMYDGDNAVKEIKGAQSATLFGSGTDRFFSRTDSAGERVMLTDGLGSVLGLVDGAGNTTTSYTYDAFGGTTSTGAASENANQYTSRENDGTGLYFYQARYYQPKIGRFISQDPARQAGSGHNWYAYTNNSPTNLTDPSGLKPRKDCNPAIQKYDFGNGQRGIMIGSCYTNWMNELAGQFSRSSNNLAYYGVIGFGSGEIANIAVGLAFSGIALPFVAAGGVSVILITMALAGLVTQMSNTGDTIAECKDSDPPRSVFIGYPENGDAYFTGQANFSAFCLD